MQVAYGRGYTGSSSGWVQEETDLSQFAGQKVLLRFEYVSDDATSLTGFAVDDIQVPEIGFSDDASGDSGWQADGFQHVTGQLPQQFIVQEIAGTGSAETVTRVPLDASNKAEIAINGPTVIVVSGATENTTDTAAYHWNLKQP